MEAMPAFIALAAALGLGLLVGLQRERADSALAGIRTFPLITIAGTLCAILADALGGWIVAAGLIAIGGATAVGNLRRPAGEKDHGITTEVAALVMFAVGATLWVAPTPVGVAVGVACALLLHLKEPIHTLVGRMEEKDVHAIMLFAAITFIILPILPDRTFGPLDVLNPRQIWWMVVLVTGISLAGYIVLKLIKGHAGLILGGLVGGLVSSTATTVSYSRRAASHAAAVPAALLAIVLASCVVYIRVLTEIGVVAPGVWGRLAPPLLAMLLVGAATAIPVWLIARRSKAHLPEPRNPTEIKAALFFAGMYAIVLLAIAAGRRFVGENAIYGIAVLSGLTDLDAVTLSTSRLAAAGSIEPESAWRAIVLAVMSNLAFKTGIAGVLGGRRLLLPCLAALGASILAGALILWLWPEGIVITLPDAPRPATP